jgi:hypothetical protein
MKLNIKYAQAIMNWRRFVGPQKTFQRGGIDHSGSSSFHRVLSKVERDAV